MSGSFAISTQAGMEYVITVNEDLHEEVVFCSDDFPIAMFTQNFNHAASDYIPLHWHDELQITWVYEGNLEYHINGDTFKLTSDKIIVVNSRQLHSSKTINTDAKTLCINFSLDFFHPLIVEKYIRPLIDNSQFSYYLLPLKTYRIRQVEKFMDWRNQPIGYFSVINFLSQTFEELLDEYKETKDNLSTEETNIFHNMLNYVHGNYAEQITVNDIASHALINKSQCTSLFNKYTKMPPIKYLNAYRLHIAKTIIINSDKPISEISADVGFNQISYFIEKFREHYGLSPLKYRQKFGNL